MGIYCDRRRCTVTKPDAEAFSHCALAMISYLLEANAPVAARSLPHNPVEAMQVLDQLKHAGLEIAALAQSVLSSRTLSASE